MAVAMYNCTVFMLVVLGALLGFTASLPAQVVTGRISGTVKDVTGGALLWAAVQANNVATGLGDTVVTDGKGRHVFVALPVGVYQISASYPGFQTLIRSGIDLAVGREAVVDFVLELSPAKKTTIVITASPIEEPSIDRRNAEVFQ
ncbi:MAG: carboxypeptidase-like regulatory domain-containing protein [bacterium]